MQESLGLPGGGGRLAFSPDGQVLIDLDLGQLWRAARGP
jgi:hypothetical protein